MLQHEKRIRHNNLQQKILSAEEAAKLVQDGMIIGMSGFTRAGDAKAVPLAMAARAKSAPFKITLITGASLGHDIDGILCAAGVVARRLPFQVDTVLRQAINRGDVMFIDQHLSHTVEQMRARQLPKADIAIIEAVAITESGGIVPTSSVGNSASLAMMADKIIVELNMAASPQWEGLHDIYIPAARPGRLPVPVTEVNSRIGMPFIPVRPEQIAAIVITHEPDSPSNITPPDTETGAIAGHLIAFLEAEAKAGRLPHGLPPMQVGIGSIANAVVSGLQSAPFAHMTMYSEVLQDSAFELMEAGKLDFASCCSVTLSEECGRRVYADFDKYRDKIILRPQEISNHPEIIRRLGLITINTALEFDIYGNVNSTHVNGTHMMNGIGGSGDFTRNAFMSVFVTKSLAKGGKISSIVPFVPHIDHTEHDVAILVTEIGLADLRGLAPRERAPRIIENCAHPAFRDRLFDYYQRACRERGGQTPHILEEALSWHSRSLHGEAM
ncbi:acetyl-CoA hydrolase/transferase family protein [Candidatus Tokpelaia sp.]|uniref:acetyl-CoA hydrolase/transferase family protein n=1 Tax=Candidatus Tokpelaia sp. TaxID=2233777 RepID=UPI001239E8D9|nr:acetyl-CoA hydrolase/transferase family protein [Candidatus Tokpelaia sp.]KAA6405183.1 propionyl-CoA--succinate CoA transferase [Candidatus Tokpelaia sp.]